MDAKISVLYNEGALPNTPFVGAHGSSYLVEVDGEKSFFGAGHRQRYLESNMRRIGIKTSDITRLVIPDGHKDEWGGSLATLVEREEPLPVFAPKSVWGEKTRFGYIGLFFPDQVVNLVERKDLEPGWTKISEHLSVGVFRSEYFEEAVLVIEAKNGPVVVTCRGMSGIKSIFEEVQKKFGSMPKAFIGALNINYKKNDALCDAVGKYLLETGCKDLRFNHTTGELGIGRLRKVMGLNAIKDFYVGESAEYKV